MLGIVAASGLIGACSSKRGPSMVLRVAGTTMGSPLRCADMMASAGVPLPGSGATKLRVTLRARGSDGQTIALCDHIINVGGSEPPFLRAPAGATAIDIFAEGFGPPQPGDPQSANAVRRLSTGALLGVDPNATSLGTLRLYPTETFSCAPKPLQQARAFHSATRLPDGRVLIVGGLVSSTTDLAAVTLPSGGATATGSAELFNPLDQSLTPVAEDVAPTGRAFHGAFLSVGSGPCPSGNLAVLLVGGLGPSIPGKPMLGPARGEQGSRLVPFDMNTIPNPLGAVALANEYLCLDAAHNTATRMSAPGAPAAAYQGADHLGARVVSAGGLEYDASMLNSIVTKQSLAAIDLTANSAVMSMTLAARAGATVTILDDTRALVWGGGATGDPIGELVTGIDGTPATTAQPGTSAMTQFHTATLLAGTTNPTVLITGGFEVTAGGVNTQPPAPLSAVRLVTINGTTATPTPVRFSGSLMADPTCNDNVTKDTRYKPAGWESAASLSGGRRVLVTGGTPSTMAVPAEMRCADCPGDASLVCALQQAVIYDAVKATLTRTTGPMQVARFGHTSTVLADGTVLIVGGIGGGTTSGFVADVEVYNPTAVLAPYDESTGADADDPVLGDLPGHDPPLRRAPGEQAIQLADPKKPAIDCRTL
jgi:hypothetical protein